jgi:hypothetical protein
MIAPGYCDIRSADREGRAFAIVSPKWAALSWQQAGADGMLYLWQPPQL